MGIQSLGSLSVLQALVGLWLPRGCTLEENICPKFEGLLLAGGPSPGEVCPCVGALGGQLDPSSLHPGSTSS